MKVSHIECPFCRNSFSLDIAKFWAQVDKGSDCWEWKSGCNDLGYGLTTFEGRSWYAHRVSHYLTNGPIPESMFVCHKCDNPRCVRPDHLFLGTAADNVADMIRKGRNYRGEDHDHTHLTEQQVKDIIIQHTTGKVSSIALAEKYNVHVSNIRDILKGRTWKHVKVDIPKVLEPHLLAGDTHPQAILTSDQVRAIREDSSKGMSSRNLAAKYGVSRSTVNDILKGRTWKGD